jgi:thymidylate synthase
MKNELDWYLSQSLNVYDLKDTPKIWKDVADKKGNINSNYGWCVFSEANGSQYLNCLHELIKNPFSRRAVMIYNRPQMWEDYKKDGMNEFMCTFTTQYFIRDNKLISIIMMRSGDSVYGYKNDKAWQDYVTNKLYQDLKEFYPQLEKGNMIWKTNSLHVYENHLFLVDHYSKTGIFDISKKEYEASKTN